MKMSTRLHACLKSGTTAGGFGFALNSPAAVEFLLLDVDLDFIIIETQHAPVSAADAAHLLRAAQSADPQATPIARVPCHDVYWIQQMLDLGFVGLVVPLCESADQARALVQATYYPPLGLRSIASAIRAKMYDDYINQANDHIILLPQIESRRGLENVEQIAAVEGVNALLLGPADLSLDCGWFDHLPEIWSYPPFIEALDRITAACNANNIPLATMVGGESVFHAQKAGLQIICSGVDTIAMRNTAPAVNDIMDRLHKD